MPEQERTIQTMLKAAYAAGRRSAAFDRVPGRRYTMQVSPHTATPSEARRLPRPRDDEWHH